MVEEERSVLGCVKVVSRGEMVSELVDQAFERVCTSTTASQHSITAQHHSTAPHRGPHTASGAGDHTTTHHRSQRHSSAQHHITPPHTAPHHDDHQITTIGNVKCFLGVWVRF